MCYDLRQTGVLLVLLLVLLLLLLLLSLKIFLKGEAVFWQW